MIKYATAIRTRTASTEAILRRSARNASYPTYAATLKVGRAQKTIFVARYLRLRDLQREIEEGLNVVESSNGANSVIAYGKGEEIASNRRGLTPLFWSHVRPYGEVNLDMDARLNLAVAGVPGTRTPADAADQPRAEQG
ncbi:Tn3 family transposase [Streptomyces hesseae]|uniref:Tn3 family transposase n=1 Tax=Streptomyces hesseae TaxID=3075519 RepID=A0ABU2SK81_9ACTN|nr:Tn3 family transposase [Streptomyces sp. DSM 40473]MDT0448319.1 Tn3 family transposase [Streptomyces sp. DSM 40473]